MALHFNTQRDEDKLPVWRCVRGSNKNETYHTGYHDLLPGNNNSFEHADSLIWVHNLR